MTLAPWRPILARALHRNRARPYCRFLQLATIDQAGKPANRTVVFRGFVHDYLQMVTDGRSQKVPEILAYPWAEICWYFTVTREQFRIAGRLTLAGPKDDAPIPGTDCSGDALRLRAWQTLSAKARQQFYWPPPGQPRQTQAAFLTETLVAEQPPDSFYVLLLKAEQVDHLNLKGDPQARHIYKLATEEWQISSVNP